MKLSRLSELSPYKVIDWGYTEELEPRSFQQFTDWVEQGQHGPLSYLADHRKDKRSSLEKVYPGARAALVFLFDYRAAKNYQEKVAPQNNLASYVIGFDDKDYHIELQDRLKDIATLLEIADYDISLDIHPVLERDLAYRAGLGWFGKNSMLISRDYGSYFLIGSLILKEKLPLKNKPLEPDHCGSCTRCLDACPTNAILAEKRSVNASRCISTFTIELFKPAPPPIGYPAETNEVFGCDICQEVCPWVRKNRGEDSLISSWLVDFFNRPKKEIQQEVQEMSNKGFKEKFKHTSLERLGKRGLLKNLI